MGNGTHEDDVCAVSEASFLVLRVAHNRRIGGGSDEDACAFHAESDWEGLRGVYPRALVRVDEVYSGVQNLRV